MAEADTARLQLTLQYVADTYRSQGDTIGYVSTLEKGFDKNPVSEYFFTHLFDYRFQRGDTTQALTLCNRSLAINAKSKVAMLAKSAVLLTINATTSAYSSAMLSSPSTTALQMLISTLAWLTSIRL